MHTNARSVAALLLGLTSFLLTSFAMGAENPNVIKVDAYKKKDGTIVQAHERTVPNNTRNDNLSTKGNLNPNTGKSGAKPRDGESTSLKRPSTAQDVPALKKSPFAKPSLSGRPARQSQTETEKPSQRSHAELVATVARCNQLLDSYVRASFGNTPFNAERYEQIRHERDIAQGELNAGR